jgi:membrane associated rhomboid family serine protease
MIPIRDLSRTRTTPIITYTLIFLNTVIFIYSMLLPIPELEAFIQTYSLIPQQIIQGENLHSLLTSMFLHGSLGHLISNMLFLNIFGDNLEDHLGHIKYLLFYLMSGVGGSLLQIFFSPGSTIPNLGASGAIAGLMGAYLVLFPYHRIEVLFSFGLYYRQAAVPAFTMLIYWIFAQFLGGLGQLAVADAGGVAYLAHIGGFAAGWLLIKFFNKSKAQSDLIRQEK